MLQDAEALCVSLGLSAIATNAEHTIRSGSGVAQTNIDVVNALAAMLKYAQILDHRERERISLVHSASIGL